MDEYTRFRKIGKRRLPQPPCTGTRFAGNRILVTGGTGCIGSELLRQLKAIPAVKLASFANSGQPSVEGVTYFEGDITDGNRLVDCFEFFRPETVFHTAAQRDPGLAEIEFALTVRTNVFGMAALLAVCEAYGTENFIYASTGKALRPFSPDTYTASKRIAEYLLSQATIPYKSGARFTHVVDNSIIHNRMLNWAHANEPFRIHRDGIMFYCQSARESAQLLIGAGEFAARCETDLHAIRDLEFPIDLTAMAQGLIKTLASSSEIRFVGYDDGYEEIAFPGLYDPETAGDCSPLINAFEAQTAFSPYPAVDAFPLRFEGAVPPASLEEMSWSVMRAAIAAVEPSYAKRVATLAHSASIPEHRKMLEIISDRAGAMV